MDPLTIATGCATLIGTIARLSLTISRFVRDMRGARSDMDSISRELSSLKSVLELLEDDAREGNSGHTSAFPETLQRQINGIMSNCNGVLDKIVAVLEKHSNNQIDRNARWVMSGREEVNGLRSSLETHKTALEIALDMVQLSISRDIKKDASNIRNDTTIIVEDTKAIRQDTAQLLQEIARLRLQIARQDDQGDVREEAVAREQNFLLQRYLDDLTSYAETVVGDEDMAGLEEPHSEADDLRRKPAEPRNSSRNEHNRKPNADVRPARPSQTAGDEIQQPNGATNEKSKINPSNIGDTRQSAGPPDQLEREQSAQRNETGDLINKFFQAPQNPGQLGSPETWEITMTEKKAFNRIFKQLLLPGRGWIDKSALIHVGRDYGVSDWKLSRIWSLVDSRDTGTLTQDEFAIAMFLINTQLGPNSPQLPSSVPEALRMSSFHPVEKGVPVVLLAPRKSFFRRIFRR